MMNTKIYLVLFFFLKSIILFSQIEPEILNEDNSFSLKIHSDILPPDVAAFQKYNALPVNHYTGKVDVNIPIFDIVSGGIKVPISLSYNTGGIKVDQLASSVGLGWNLNAGGSVFRKINDAPDNQVRIGVSIEYDWDVAASPVTWPQTLGYNRSHDRIKAREVYSANFPQIGTVDAAYHESPYNVDASHHIYALNYPNGIYGEHNIHNDFAPDIFFANAPDLKCAFTLTRENQNFLENFSSATFVGKTLNHSGVKIGNVSLETHIANEFIDVGFVNNQFSLPELFESSTWNAPIRDFFSFDLTNSLGIKYHFSKPDIVESYIIPSNWNSSDYTWLDKSKNGRRNYNKSINTWNLERIDDNTSNKSVIFEYEEYGKQISEINRFVEAIYYGTNNGNCEYEINPNYFRNPPLSYGGYRPPYQGPIEYLTQAPLLHRLKKIHFDGGVVEFIYGTRIDDVEEKALNEIVVKDYNGKIIKRVKLHQTYFQVTGCNDPECYRLHLDSVEIVDENNNTLGQYSFEYYESNSLPKRGSVQQDFLGYYNANGVSGLGDSFTKPKLYYYKNLYENSILPFQLSDRPYDTYINGDLDLTPNMYSQTASLYKISYPSGGSTEFEYENNSFMFLGQEYISGGVRVKKQILNDGRGNINTINYEYLMEDGTSSGRINNLPIFGYPKRINSSGTVTSFYVYDQNKANIELTQNSFVGYSRVIERKNGNGFTIYEYTSPEDFPHEPNNRSATSGMSVYGLFTNSSISGNYCFSCSDKLIKNSAVSQIYFQEKDYLRGKPKRISIFDENGNILKKTDYTYHTDNFETIQLNNNTQVGTEPTSTFTEFGERILLINNTSQFKYSRNLLINETITDYFETGTQMNTTKVFDYDSEYPFIKETQLISSTGNLLRKIYYYPFDVGINSEPFMTDLIDVNRVSKPVKKETYNDNELIATEKFIYHDFGSGLINRKSLLSSKGNEVLEEGTVIIRRDENGNVLEYKEKDGVHHVLIWGYHKKYLIAKIDNARYSVIESQVSALQNASNLDDDRTINYFGNEGVLRQLLDNLRNDSQLSNAMVTTYTYDPLIGVTSITDPKGDTQYYIYDSSNRLHYIKDKDGYILKEYEYHYKE